MRAINMNFIGEPTLIKSEDGALTVAIPIRIKRGSGRREIMAPQGLSGTLTNQPTPTALQVALAKGHRWLRQIESGQVSNLTEIAKQENLDRSYISRMVNLTTLAPDIVSAILDETLSENVALSDLAIDTPLSWKEQRQRLVEAANKVRGGGK